MICRSSHNNMLCMRNKDILYRINRLKKNKYTVIHLVGRIYLVRKYSKNYKRFSIYIPTIFRRYKK